MDRRDNRTFGPHHLPDRSVSTPLEYVSEVSHVSRSHAKRAQESQMPARDQMIYLDTIFVSFALWVLCSAGNREIE